MEAALEQPPGDLLRRRVRVCQHYHIPWDDGACLNRIYGLYDESKDSFFTLKWKDLFFKSFGLRSAARVPKQHIIRYVSSWEESVLWVQQKNGQARS